MTATRWQTTGALLAAVLTCAAVLAMPLRASADTGSDLRVLSRVRAICDGAPPGDTAAARQAVAVLSQGLAESQPELDAYLTAVPPDFQSASDRIGALEAALQRPVSTSAPGKADADLKSILADPRYQVNGPSIFDRIWAWLIRQLERLLSLIQVGTSGASLAQLVEAALAGLVVLVAAVFLVRSLLGRFRRRAEPAPPSPVRRPASDWFAEADHLATAGDLAAALRALTMAVATRVGGEDAWDRSPLTVRELFGKASMLSRLRPLVVPFEAVVYGHRLPDAQTYAAAAAAAMPFRDPSRQAAAA